MLSPSVQVEVYLVQTPDVVCFSTNLYIYFLTSCTLICLHLNAYLFTFLSYMYNAKSVMSRENLHVRPLLINVRSIF